MAELRRTGERGAGGPGAGSSCSKAIACSTNIDGIRDSLCLHVMVTGFFENIDTAAAASDDHSLRIGMFANIFRIIAMNASERPMRLFLVYLEHRMAKLLNAPS